MPTRSTPNSLAVAYRGQYTEENGTVYDLNPEASQTFNWVDSVTFGDNIPGWRDNLRAGLSATTSMVGSIFDARLTNGHILATLPTGPGTGNGIKRCELTGYNRVSAGIPAGDPQSIDEARANAEALGRFVKRAYQLRTSIQGGVVLGELRQTLQTIRNPARGLRRLADDWLHVARDLRRGKGIPAALRPRKVAENLADAWLEVQFGWKPLLNDIRDGSEALRRYGDGQKVQTCRVTGKYESKSDSSEFLTIYQSSSFLTWGVKDITVNSCMVIYRGAIRVQARDPLQMDPALIGFDLSSWVPTAWELIPYSFLIDYFTNVGDVILGWSTLGMPLVWANKTTRRSVRLTSETVKIPSWDLYQSVTHVPAKFVGEKRHVLRAEYNGTTVPDFTWRLPGFGSQRWLNIAALVVSRNSDRKWSFD